MGYLGLDHVDLLSLHGINNEEVYDLAMRKGGCLDAARKIQAEGRARFIGFSTHAPWKLVLRTVATGEFDYVNLHWYFVYDLNWPAIQEAARRDMGVFIISPNDKGGKLYEPPAKLARLCEPLSPMIFNDLYCLARPEVHTLSIGASRPSDFDEHIRALEYYDQRGGSHRPGRAAPARGNGRRARRRLAGELDAGNSRVHGDARARSTCWKSCGSGPSPSRWTWLNSARCGTTCWERRPLVSRAKCGAMGPRGYRPGGKREPVCRPHPGILEEAHALLAGEERKRLSQSD